MLSFPSQTDFFFSYQPGLLEKKDPGDTKHIFTSGLMQWLPKRSLFWYKTYITKLNLNQT